MYVFFLSDFTFAIDDQAILLNVLQFITFKAILTVTDHKAKQFPWKRWHKITLFMVDEPLYKYFGKARLEALSMLYFFCCGLSVQSVLDYTSENKVSLDDSTVYELCLVLNKITKTSFSRILSSTILPHHSLFVFPSILQVCSCLVIIFRRFRFVFWKVAGTRRICTT